METKDKYSRIANIFDKLEERMPMNEIKKEAVQMLKGKILEIGIGSGACLKYYDKKSDVTGTNFYDKSLICIFFLCNSFAIKKMVE